MKCWKYRRQIAVIKTQPRIKQKGKGKFKKKQTLNIHKESGINDISIKLEGVTPQEIKNS